MTAENNATAAATPDHGAEAVVRARLAVLYRRLVVHSAGDDVWLNIDGVPPLELMTACGPGSLLAFAVRDDRPHFTFSDPASPADVFEMPFEILDLDDLQLICRRIEEVCVRRNA